MFLVLSLLVPFVLGIRLNGKTISDTMPRFVVVRQSSGPVSR